MKSRPLGVFVSLSPDSVDTDLLWNVLITAAPAATTMVVPTLPTVRANSTENVLPIWTNISFLAAVLNSV